MTYTELIDIGRERWLQLRHAGIGASEIAAVMGRSPWSSPFDTHWKKRVDDPTDEGGNEYTGWGQRIEPLIIAHFAEQHPEFRVRSKVGICVNDDRDWQRATPDALLTEASAWQDRPTHLIGLPQPEPVAGLETKNAHDRREWDDAEWQGIPQHYYDQVQHSMDVTGLTSWWVAVLFGGNTYAEFEITYDDAYARELRDAGEAFWNDIQAERAPDLDAHLATARRLIALHPDLDDTEVEVDDDLADRYRAACQAYDDAKTAKDKATNEIRAAIGNGHYAFSETGEKVATRSVYDQTRIDTDRLKTGHPTIAAECSNTTTVHKISPARARKRKAAA